MTASMLRRRCLRAAEKYSLPAQETTGAALARAGVRADADQLSAAKLAAHLSNGGATRGIYWLVPPGKVGGPFASGMLLGSPVWTASYLGLLSALRILRPVTEHPVRGKGLMLGAYVTWDVFLSALHHSLLDYAWRATPALSERSVAVRDTYTGNHAQKPTTQRQHQAS